MVASTRLLMKVSDTELALPIEKVNRIIGLDLKTTGTMYYEDADGNRDKIAVEADTQLDLKIRKIFATGTTAGLQVYALLGEGF